MERMVLPKYISRRLRGFNGKTLEDKIVSATEQAAATNLRECNERISGLESRYGLSFSNFESAWERGAIQDAHGYHTETDFIEWEALELEKEHWLSMIRSLHSQKERIADSLSSGG